MSNKIVRDAVAVAINDFLYQISLGYTPKVAFERAVNGETRTALRTPSNLRIEVVQEKPAEQTWKGLYLRVRDARIALWWPSGWRRPRD